MQICPQQQQELSRAFFVAVSIDLFGRAEPRRTLQILIHAGQAHTVFFSFCVQGAIEVLVHRRDQKSLEGGA
jgi:hypothetical protein